MNHFSKHSKRALSLLLALALLMSLGTAAFAVGAEVSVGAATASAGDSLVIVPVTITGNTGFGFLNFQVATTPAAGIAFLNAVGSFAEYDDANATSYADDYPAGICDIGTLAASAATGKIGFMHTANRTKASGTMFYLLYSVAPGTAAGVVPLTMAQSEGSANPAGTITNEVMPVAFTSGAITVAATAPETSSKYTVSLASDSTIQVGETATVALSVASAEETTYNAVDVTLDYNSDALTYAGVTQGFTADTSTAGKIRVYGVGNNKAVGSDAFTLTFTGKAAGAGTVMLSSAKIDKSANAVSADAPNAKWGTSLVTIAVNGAQASFGVALGEHLTGRETAEPGSDYTFSVDDFAHYNHVLTVTANGVDISAHIKNNNDGTYTIPSAYVTGAIVVNTARTAKSFDVTFNGTGAADVSANAAKATYNTNYTFTINKAAGYSYAVSAAIGENPVAVAEESGTYKIAGASVTGNIAITVTKALDVSVTVTEYLKLNDKSVFLVKATGTPGSGNTYAYNGNSMFWSAEYNAYAYLVISGTTLDIPTAKAALSITAGTAANVVYTGDVNSTTVIDINDAQLTYDLYNAKYSDFTTVSMLKFLRADVQTDSVLNTLDAAAVIAKVMD